MMQCPCQSDKSYKDCCERFHNGEASAPTAERLMRSRYSAYVLKNDKYLYKTWAIESRPTKKALRQEQTIDWLGLTIIARTAGTIFDNEGSVEFIARYEANEKTEQLHETSRFVRQNGKWVYLDGFY